MLRAEARNKECDANDHYRSEESVRALAVIVAVFMRMFVRPVLLGFAAGAGRSVIMNV
jgi:hypothetical protein